MRRNFVFVFVAVGHGVLTFIDLLLQPLTAIRSAIGKVVSAEDEELAVVKQRQSEAVFQDTLHRNIQLQARLTVTSCRAADMA